MIENGICAKASMASLFGIASVFLLPYLLIIGDNLFATTTHLAVAFYMAIVPMFIGYLLFALGLRHVEASKATLITLFEPVVATLLAIIILGETFDINGWIGISLLTICLILQVIKLPKLA